MKIFAMFVAMIALLTALCSAQPVDSSAPGQPNTSVNVRVKRQNIITLQCPCKKGEVILGHSCITCEQYMDLRGDDEYPDCCTR